MPGTTRRPFSVSPDLRPLAAKAATTVRAVRRERRFPAVQGHVRVAAVSRPAPRIARITLEGECVRRFPHDEPGEYVTLIWPLPGTTDVVLPVRGWRFPGDGAQQHSRNYTVRHLDRERGRLDVDVVLHGGDGHGTSWAAAARPGDVLGIAGPRIHWISDPGAETVLLVGDETALAAVAAILRALPTTVAAVAVLAVRDHDDRAALGPVPDRTRVVWIHHGERGRADGEEIVDHLRALDLPPGRLVAWAGGESRAVRTVREHLRDERGLGRASVWALGYWLHREDPVDA